jgi:hypothetical protein
MRLGCVDTDANNKVLDAIGQPPAATLTAAALMSLRWL